MEIARIQRKRQSVLALLGLTVMNDKREERWTLALILNVLHDKCTSASSNNYFDEILEIDDGLVLDSLAGR